MTTFNMHQAKSQLSKLVERARTGEDVIIARNGTPIVRLTPVVAAPKRLRPIGLHDGQVVIHDNFDDPLPEEFMKAFR